MEKVKAIHDYQGRSANELTFSKGAIIDVISKRRPSWWEGRIGDVVGKFLSNYVEPMQDASEQQEELHICESIYYANKPDIDQEYTSLSCWTNILILK